MYEKELPIWERIASTCVTESIVPVEDTGITEQESEYDSALDEEGDQLVHHVQPERDPWNVSKNVRDSWFERT